MYIIHYKTLKKLFFIGELTNKSLSAMNYYAYKFMCHEITKQISMCGDKHYV